jgi:hypothetical protein
MAWSEGNKAAMARAASKKEPYRPAGQGRALRGIATMPPPDREDERGNGRWKVAIAFRLLTWPKWAATINTAALEANLATAEEEVWLT